MKINKIKQFARKNGSKIAVVTIATGIIVWQHKCIVEALELLAENNIEIPK